MSAYRAAVSVVESGAGFGFVDLGQYDAHMHWVCALRCDYAVDELVRAPCYVPVWGDVLLGVDVGVAVVEVQEVAGTRELRPVAVVADATFSVASAVHWLLVPVPVVFLLVQLEMFVDFLGDDVVDGPVFVGVDGLSASFQVDAT